MSLRALFFNGTYNVALIFFSSLNFQIQLPQKLRKY